MVRNQKTAGDDSEVLLKVYVRPVNMYPNQMQTAMPYDYSISAYNMY